MGGVANLTKVDAHAVQLYFQCGISFFVYDRKITRKRKPKTCKTIVYDFPIVLNIQSPEQWDLVANQFCLHWNYVFNLLPAEKDISLACFTWLMKSHLQKPFISLIVLFYSGDNLFPSIIIEFEQSSQYISVDFFLHNKGQTAWSLKAFVFYWQKFAFVFFSFFIK